MTKPGSEKRARQRFHRDRIVRKRIAQYVREGFQDWAYLRQMEAEGRTTYARPLDEGRFEDEQPHMGCRRAGCGMCHAHKHDAGGERKRRERDAMAVENAAW